MSEVALPSVSHISSQCRVVSDVNLQVMSTVPSSYSVCRCCVAVNTGRKLWSTALYESNRKVGKQ
jgi:hypothetical protein